jgi:signal transduction histidine kinase
MGFVEANRGALSVESLPGQGSTFIVSLPRDGWDRAVA